MNFEVLNDSILLGRKQFKQSVEVNKRELLFQFFVRRKTKYSSKKSERIFCSSFRVFKAYIRRLNTNLFLVLQADEFLLCL